MGEFDYTVMTQKPRAWKGPLTSSSIRCVHSTWQTDVEMTVYLAERCRNYNNVPTSVVFPQKFIINR